MLSKLPKYREKIRLIPFSGIQFLEFGFSPALSERRTADFWEEKRSEGEREFAILRRVKFDTESQSFCVVDTNENVDDETQIYSVKIQDAVDIFTNRWLPVPFYRVHDRPRNQPILFIDGPTTWARLRIIKLLSPDERGNTHRIIIALDTSIENATSDTDAGNAKNYYAPTRSDSEALKEFQFVDDYSRIAAFLSRDWVSTWVEEIYGDHLESVRSARNKRIIRQPQEGEMTLKAWANYLTALDCLQEMIDFPIVQLGDLYTEHSSQQPIMVDLVLDIGNSRTCGMLCEHHDGDIPSLSNSYPLSLRDLSRPEHVYSDPFESRVEFARADFGNEQLASRSGRSDSFVWHSMVRTGPEATALCNATRGGVGASGLSSPKRYLWDERPTRNLWHFNASLSKSDEIEPLVDSQVMQYISDGGEVLGLLRGRKRQETTAAFEPRFSRSSLFTLLLQEIIFQAFTQINSPANRDLRPNSERPRRLSQIVLTLPPGMPLAERKLFRQRAEEAIHLTWDCLRGQHSALFNIPQPKLVEPFDEASSTQIVYLYSEASRLQHGLLDLFSVLGRQRLTYKDGKSLRVATIDIGGGTTDLMVTTYSIKSTGQVIPDQNFRESFRIAGDDILREIVRQHIMESISSHLVACGGSYPEVLLGKLFGANVAAMSVDQTKRRAQFILEVAMPIGLQILNECEDFVPTSQKQNLRRQLRDFFVEGSLPSERVQRFIESEAPNIGASDFKLLDTPIDIDLFAVKNTIEGVIEPVFQDLCEVVNNLQSDLLLLSGRLSRLPLIKNLIKKQLPLPPDRVIAMSDYRVGGWYPFRNHLGQISDPKTTTAIGAMLAWLARGRLPNFRFESSLLKHKSTARFIGPLGGRDVLRRDAVIMNNVDLDEGLTDDGTAAVDMVAPFFLGYRQLSLERWPTMPLYYFEFCHPSTVEREGLPWKVTIGPKPGLSEDDDLRFEDFAILAVESNADGMPTREPTISDVSMRLQTMKNADGYWLDTGIIGE
jgi:hypothetical protein